MPGPFHHTRCLSLVFWLSFLMKCSELIGIFCKYTLLLAFECNFVRHWEWIILFSSIPSYSISPHSIIHLHTPTHSFLVATHVIYSSLFRLLQEVLIGAFPSLDKEHPKFNISLHFHWFHFMLMIRRLFHWFASIEVIRSHVLDKNKSESTSGILKSML